MVSYGTDAYMEMYGDITLEAANAVSCMGQCTGCKCSCKCSCKNRPDDDFEWEEI